MRSLVSVAKTMTFAALAAFTFAACESAGPCQRQYDTAGEQRACMIGSDEVAVKIQSEQGALTGHSGHVACTNACGHRYNPDSIPVGNNDAYHDELGRMTDLFVACSQACKVRLRYEADMLNIRDAGADYGCEMVRMGMVTRCI